VLAAFIAQFYDDKPPPSLVLISHEVEDQALLAEALSARAGRRVEVQAPKRGEKKDLVDHAHQNAREALGRQLAESASQMKLLQGVAAVFGLPAPPRRIEVYDNSHIMGSNAVGGMIVAGPEGFRRRDYRTFNIKSDIAPGDDFGMMREVLERRFKRLLKDAPKPEGDAETRGALSEEAAPGETVPDGTEADGSWPDLVLIDGGPGQLAAARAILAELGIVDVPLVGVAKGRDREAGRETFHMAGREPFRLEPRDPVLYFLQRLRDEAHRFAIGTHRGRRKKDIRSAGLAEIGGIGPARKRALLNHFGTLKAIERASLDDLLRAPGINAGTAQAVYNFFHPQG
ncbi:MAG: excinuclease ABC subunit UvrC, partial [Phreatobacter sp.]|nr:excinuclease ABC subunit UvrC [Phreatobacter sp.]